MSCVKKYPTTPRPSSPPPAQYLRQGEDIEVPRSFMLDKFGRCNSCGRKWQGKNSCDRCHTILFQNTIEHDVDEDCFDEVDDFEDNHIKYKGMRIARPKKTGWFSSRSVLSRLLE